MSNPVGDVITQLSTFEGSTIFYPSANISFTFENRTTPNDRPWLAGYTDNVDSQTPALSSGQDLYNYFVLSIPPIDVSAAATIDLSTAAISTIAAAATSSLDSSLNDTSINTPTPTPSVLATPSSWSYALFPSNLIVAQPNLGLAN